MERFRSESTDKGECDLTVKVILLGDFDVNKGTLIQALKALPKVDRDVTCLKSIPGMVEMMFRRDEKRVKVKINDTAGQERFRSLTSSYYRGAHGCLLMFDVNKRDTFESLSDWQQELKKYTATEELVTVLVGCIFEKEDRQVPKRTAQEFASYHDIDYDEVNVQHVSTLLTVLQEMVDRIIQKASCSPTMSITITPLHKKMDNARQEKEQVRIRTVCSC